MSFDNYLLPSTDFEQACNLAVNAINQAKEKALTAVENLKGADLLPIKIYFEKKLSKNLDKSPNQY